MIGRVVPGSDCPPRREFRARRERRAIDRPSQFQNVAQRHAEADEVLVVRKWVRLAKNANAICACPSDESMKAPFQAVRFATVAAPGVK